MSIQPLSEIEIDDYGDEIWLGGLGHGMITVGEWVSGGYKKTHPSDWEELLKQAALIAAAPDLLEALEAAIECGMVPISSAKEGGAMKHSIQVKVADQIRAAIARAKGESK